MYFKEKARRTDFPPLSSVTSPPPRDLGTGRASQRPSRGDRCSRPSGERGAQTLRRFRHLLPRFIFLRNDFLNVLRSAPRTEARRASSRAWKRSRLEVKGSSCRSPSSGRRSQEGPGNLGRRGSDSKQAANFLRSKGSAPPPHRPWPPWENAHSFARTF